MWSRSIIGKGGVEMSLVEHAKHELVTAGLFDKDSDYGGMLGDAVMELVKVFAGQGHSGMSAAATLSLFTAVASFKPLKPLTFEDDEWNEVHGNTFQNCRNSAVFKDGRSGRPYFINAFSKRKGDTGTCWSGNLDLVGNRKLCRCYIKDPADMPTIVLDVPVKHTGADASDWDFLPVSEDVLGELKKHYDLEIMRRRCDG